MLRQATRSAFSSRSLVSLLEQGSCCGVLPTLSAFSPSTSASRAESLQLAQRALQLIAARAELQQPDRPLQEAQCSLPHFRERAAEPKGYDTSVAGRRGISSSTLVALSPPPSAQEEPAEAVELERRSDLGANRHSLEEEDDFLRKVKMPLIHPKASVTSEHHPCGAELLEFPFGAKAFYVGKGYRACMQKLRKAASEQKWQTETKSGSTVICLRQSDLPFNDEEDYMGLPCETYVIPQDRMESVVFFNGFGKEEEIWQQHTGGQLTSRFFEETRVTVIPDLDKHSRLFSDRVVLQQAELNYLRTIAFVLGQTVSLHYYELQVDHILRTFKDMNKEMQRTGTFKPIATKEELLQMVAQNNLLFSDIISKLGIMERFDIAWRHTNCNDVYEHLRADMEIENRNDNLQVKLHLVSENVKYLLELMQNQKSDFLEWIIIILIGAEILVSLFDMLHKLN